MCGQQMIKILFLLMRGKTIKSCRLLLPAIYVKHEELYHWVLFKKKKKNPKPKQRKNHTVKEKHADRKTDLQIHFKIKFLFPIHIIFGNSVQTARTKCCVEPVPVLLWAHAI